MAKVKQEFTGDAAKLLAEYAKMREAMLKLEQGQQKLVDQSKKQADGVLSAANIGTAANKRFSASVTGLVTQYASATTALQLLNAETERQNRLAQAAVNANITVADAQSAVLANLGKASDAEASKLFADIANVQKQTGFQSQAPLLMAAAQILSSTTTNLQRTTEIIEAAAPFFKSRPQDLATFGGAAGDFMKITGETDADRAIGLMMTIQSQSRFSDLTAFKQVAQALSSASVTQPGVDRTQAAREVGAIFAAFGGEIGDVDAAITKTAVGNLAAKLQQVFPAEGLSVIDRLKQSWVDPEAQKKILQGSFDGATRPLIEQLVTNPQSQVSQAALAALENIQASDEIVDMKRRQLNELTEPLRTARTERQSAANLEEFQLGGAGGSARAGKVLADTLAEINSGYGSDMSMTRWRWMMDASPDAAMKILQERHGDIMYGGFRKFVSDDPVELNQMQKAQLQYIEAQLQVLKEIKTEVERTNKRQPPPSPTVHQEAR